LTGNEREVLPYLLVASVRRGLSCRRGKTRDAALNYSHVEDVG